MLEAKSLIIPQLSKRKSHIPPNACVFSGRARAGIWVSTHLARWPRVLFVSWCLGYLIFFADSAIFILLVLRFYFILLLLYFFLVICFFISFLFYF
jgi:hypothetical protein